MRIAYLALTGRVDSVSTLDSVGRRGRGLEPKGGPPASCGVAEALPDPPRVPADAGYMSRCMPRVPVARTGERRRMRTAESVNRKSLHRREELVRYLARHLVGEAAADELVFQG